MIYIQNTVDKSFLKCITGECVDWTDVKFDAFDFDKMPTEKEKQDFQNWILGAGTRIPVEFVEG